MNLQLVVDNTHSDKNNHRNTKVKTCRDCIFYDQITELCGVFNNVNLDDPRTAKRCMEFSEWNQEDNDDDVTYELIEDEFSLEFEDDDFLFEIMGDKFSEENSKYPLEPDLPSNREDAIWYIAPDQAFGCWIINHSKKKFAVIDPNKEVKKGWSTKVYKSPYPLHNHNSSVPLRSRMAWFVDEDGWGQYVLLVNGKIDMLNEPRPKNWKS